MGEERAVVARKQGRRTFRVIRCAAIQLYGLTDDSTLIDSCDCNWRAIGWRPPKEPRERS